MSTKLAPRPANEDQRVKAVIKTGLIDAPDNTAFQIYCELAKDITGFEYASFSLFDADMQCSIAKVGDDDEKPGDKGLRHENNICSYVLLDTEPLLMKDMSKDPIWKNHPEFLKGTAEWYGYAGFPVINKDNYALGTLCLLNGEPSSLTKKQIELIKGLAERIAHQIDLQTDQKETTSDSMHQAIKKFTNRVHVNDLDLLNKFLNVCSGKIIAEEELEHLKKTDLAKKDPSGEIVLTENGKTLLSEMKLQPKVMKRNVIDTDGRPTFLDDLLGEL